MSELNHLNPLERKLYLALKDAREWISDSRSDDWISSTAALAAAETPPEAPYYPEKGEWYQYSPANPGWTNPIMATRTREEYIAGGLAVGCPPINIKYRPAEDGGV